MDFKNMFEPATHREFVDRINKLTPTTQHLWGKMNVGQMLAHCCKPLEVALGDETMKVSFVMKLFAPVFRGVVLGKKPFKKNAPTAPDFLVTDEKEFEKEKAHLLSLLDRFCNSKAAMDHKDHPFFGKTSVTEWSDSQYKHLDHHLRQFGV